MKEVLKMKNIKISDMTLNTAFADKESSFSFKEKIVNNYLVTYNCNKLSAFSRSLL